MINIKEKKKSKASFWLLLALFSAVFIFGGVKLGESLMEYQKADKVHEELNKYNPAQADDENSIVENASVIALQERYPDVCGWLKIDNTKIDYCFTKAEDNDKYLRRTLDGDYIISGTLFLDYRCQRDLSGFNSIIFGHNMRNKTMFGILPSFADRTFFNEHTTGTVYLPHATYELEIFAYLLIPSTDPIIYNPDISADEFLPYVIKKAKYYRELEWKEDDRVLTLSACDKTFTNARSVIIAKIKK